MRNVDKRVLQFANYIIEKNATLRQTAKVFGYSKSTVHNDISKKLKKIDNNLFEQVKIILDINFNEKHLRGGEATKNKYFKIKNEK